MSFPSCHLLSTIQLNPPSLYELDSALLVRDSSEKEINIKETAIFISEGIGYNAPRP